MDALDIDQQVETRYLLPDENDRKKNHLTRMKNLKQYRDLQLSTSKLAFQLVSLTKTRELPNGSLAKAWASLKDEYDPSEAADKIKVLEGFQNNKLLNAKVNITEWLASLATQVKLNRLKHPIDDDYLMTHIWASLPEEYSPAVDHAKIDWRTKTLTLTELKKRLKEKYMQLQNEKGWGEDKMALSGSHNNVRNQNKGSGP